MRVSPSFSLLTAHKTPNFGVTNFPTKKNLMQVGLGSLRLKSFMPFKWFHKVKESVALKRESFIIPFCTVVRVVPPSPNNLSLVFS